MAATLRSAAAPAAMKTRRSVSANAASRPLWAPGKELRTPRPRGGGGQGGDGFPVQFSFFALDSFLLFCSLCRLPLFDLLHLTLTSFTLAPSPRALLLPNPTLTNIITFRRRAPCLPQRYPPGRPRLRPHRPRRRPQGARLVRKWRLFFSLLVLSLDRGTSSFRLFSSFLLSPPFQITSA